MKTITIKDKKFELYITAATIHQRVNAIAETINADYEKKKPLFLVILNGAFLFAADLMKQVTA